MPTDKLYEIEPSPECPNGTRGRMAVYEMYEMDKEIEEAVLKHATELEIRALVRKKGMISLQEDAIMKCAAGLIPFEEVNTLA
jgi:type II secretory ATPase GspE/PulE/Tfp pilus assembly ATPase PilB-like protein